MLVRANEGNHEIDHHSIMQLENRLYSKEVNSLLTCPLLIHNICNAMTCFDPERL